MLNLAYLFWVNQKTGWLDKLLYSWIYIFPVYCNHLLVSVWQSAWFVCTMVSPPEPSHLYVIFKIWKIFLTNRHGSNLWKLSPLILLMNYDTLTYKCGGSRADTVLQTNQALDQTDTIVFDTRRTSIRNRNITNSV